MTDGHRESMSFDKPVPRDPKSPEQAAQIHARNRRREYLQRHPSYYESLDHELAGMSHRYWAMVNVLTLPRSRAL